MLPTLRCNQACNMPLQLVQLHSKGVLHGRHLRLHVVYGSLHPADVTFRAGGAHVVALGLFPVAHRDGLAQGHPGYILGQKFVEHKALVRVDILRLLLGEELAVNEVEQVVPLVVLVQAVIFEVRFPFLIELVAPDAANKARRLLVVRLLVSPSAGR